VSGVVYASTQKPSDNALLQSACEKIVAYREKVGVNTEQMIVMLDQGITIRDLLNFLGSQGSPPN
jgi:hypothetical protein